MSRPTVAEVDLSAIKDNIRAIRARVGPKVKIIPAVKADAYGHGAVAVSLACLDAGADILGVACVDEAIELRNAGIQALILILGCSLISDAEAVVEHDLIATCCDASFARALSRSAEKRGKTAWVHVKVDTGMGRIGVRPEDAINFVHEVAALPNLRVDGIFTHFPSADEPDRSFTMSQIATFKKIVFGLNHDFPERSSWAVSSISTAKSPADLRIIAHASNSAGILAYPEADFDAVRPGIMIYGCYPSEHVPRSVSVREALTLKTRIVFLKQCEPGTCISYGRTHVTSRRCLIATIPVGYADGYSRRLSNLGEVAVKGVRVPVVGRVCMDQTMIDVTDVPGVALGDEVVLYGGGYDYLSVARVAELIGTIPYEVFCSISSRVPRVYVDSPELSGRTQSIRSTA
ncbi:MAG: alanine racemase [Armatimonadetes bacterium]|nr:alanine racemase [Armatimonadota bacterium]